MEDFKYKTIFSSEIKPLVSEEKDKYLAMASLMDIADFIPDVDAEKNIDLLPIAFNAFVANRVNKNDDIVNSETATIMAKNFVNKPINIEHDRHRVLGTILSVGYSEFGTDKKITEEEAKNMAGPFNVTLGGVLWRVVNSELTDIVEEASDPTSVFYKKISASWELGFDEYQLVLMDDFEKNLENAELISNDDRINELKDSLRSLGGSGEYEGKKVYRQCIGQVLPLGIGLTESPAADVVGVATENSKSESIELAAESAVTQKNKLKNKIIEKSISQSEKNNVIEDKDNVMKITSINDITDETSASAVSDFIEEELKKASEKFTVKKTELEDAVKATDEKHQALVEEHESIKKEFDSVKSVLETLEAEKTEREKTEKFNERMSTLDDEYALSDEEREVIASEIKEMDDKEFSAYSDKLAILLNSKNKAVLAKAEEAKASEEQKVEATEAQEEATVSEEKASEEEVVEEAVDQAEQAGEEIPVTTAAEEPTIQDKYKDAFSIDNFEIKI